MSSSARKRGPESGYLRPPGRLSHSRPERPGGGTRRADISAFPGRPMKIVHRPSRCASPLACKNAGAGACGRARGAGRDARGCRRPVDGATAADPGVDRGTKPLPVTAGLAASASALRSHRSAGPVPARSLEESAGPTRRRCRDEIGDVEEHVLRRRHVGRTGRHGRVDVAHLAGVLVGPSVGSERGAVATNGSTSSSKGPTSSRAGTLPRAHGLPPAEGSRPRAGRARSARRRGAARARTWFVERPDLAARTSCRRVEHRIDGATRRLVRTFHRRQIRVGADVVGSEEQVRDCRAASGRSGHVSTRFTSRAPRCQVAGRSGSGGCGIEEQECRFVAEQFLVDVDER